MQAKSACLIILHTACTTAFSLEGLHHGNKISRQAAFKSFDHDSVRRESLSVEGALPSWLQGSYVRNGPGLFESGDGRRLAHWFDGYGMLMSISLAPDQPPQLSTRFIASDAYGAAKAGPMGFAEFMTPLTPPGSGPMAVVKAFGAMAAGDPTDNACVNVFNPGTLGVDGASLVAMTETHRSWFRVDPSSLETLSRVPWAGGSHGGVGQLATAHPQPDPCGGGFINVGTDIAPPFSSCFRVYRCSSETPFEREVLATIPCDNSASPNWLHSFGATKKAVVVIEQPVRAQAFIPARTPRNTCLGQASSSRARVRPLCSPGRPSTACQRCSG